MFIGPNYPSDSSTYTNDPHLNCQSNLYNPRACIHNSSAYEAVLSDLYQVSILHKIDFPCVQRPYVTKLKEALLAGQWKAY